jgi:hypothetical protein
MDFVNNIIEKLKEMKKLSDSSINVYIGNLKKLNGNKPFGDFTFLENVDSIVEKLSKYKETTKKNYLVSIVSVLSLFPDTASLKDLHDKYYALMLNKKEELEKADTGEMSEKQAENWIDWDSVKARYKELSKEVDGFYKKKTIDDNQYNTLLAFAILSLYVLVPPRRNKDYQLMNVVDTFNSDMDKSLNYYNLAGRRFIFNNYKTAKKYGRFDYMAPVVLQKALNKYLKHRDTRLPADDRDNKPLLLKSDGLPLARSNDITKLLNKVFGKNIGTSMLRHIFITDKYGDLFKATKNDSDAMAHSLDEQRKYARTPRDTRPQGGSKFNVDV